MNKIENSNTVYRQRLSKIEKFALVITKKVGTFYFFLVVFVWTLIWLLWNTLMPEGFRFDPYPAFVIWLFISNMLQIFLMPLIMVADTLQSKHAEVRAEKHYEADIKADQAVSDIMCKLEENNKLLNEILAKLNR